jgi:hypothetical protein
MPKLLTDDMILTLAYRNFYFDRLALDLSSLTGGAPGRTRGLKIQPVNPIANGLKAIR